MLRWLRSLFEDPGDPGDPQASPTTEGGPAAAEAKPTGQADVLSDLIDWVCSSNKDPVRGQVDASAQISYAEAMGLGSARYELVELG